jgi:hypothetical protein
MKKTLGRKITVMSSLNGSAGKYMGWGEGVTQPAPSLSFYSRILDRYLKKT